MKELLEREFELTAIEELLRRRSGMLAIEAGAGMHWSGGRSNASAAAR